MFIWCSDAATCRCKTAMISRGSPSGSSYPTSLAISESYLHKLSMFPYAQIVKYVHVCVCIYKSKSVQAAAGCANE